MLIRSLVIDIFVFIEGMTRSCESYKVKKKEEEEEVHLIVCMYWSLVIFQKEHHGPQ